LLTVFRLGRRSNAKIKANRRGRGDLYTKRDIGWGLRQGPKRVVRKGGSIAYARNRGGTKAPSLP